MDAADHRIDHLSRTHCPWRYQLHGILRGKKRKMILAHKKWAGIFA
jgi:hypothetical protein